MKMMSKSTLIVTESLLRDVKTTVWKISSSRSLFSPRKSAGPELTIIMLTSKLSQYCCQSIGCREQMKQLWEKWPGSGSRDVKVRRWRGD